MGREFEKQVKSNYMIEEKVKQLHYIEDEKYHEHVVNVYNLATAYPDRVETQDQLDKLNYTINHRLIPTKNSLTTMLYEDTKSVVIIELDRLDDGTMFEAKRMFQRGMSHYVHLVKLGVVDE